MRQVAVIVIVTLLAAGSGCGTIANMHGETFIHMGGPFPCPTEPFGGVQQDVSGLRMPLGFMLLADLPFSFVGDIVTLPWTTGASRNEPQRPTEKDMSTKTFSPGA